MLQQLRVILAAEAEARERLDAARQESVRRLQHAEEEARRTAREAQAAREATARAEEESLVAAAEVKAGEIVAEARARIVALRQRAEPRLDRAAALVVQAVLGAEATEPGASSVSAESAGAGGVSGPR
jgi:vacuolar-type H+-ATPase subunit H